MRPEPTVSLTHCLSLIWLLLATQVFAQGQGSPSFQELLKEAGLSFTTPAEFEEISLQTSPFLQHEKAIRNRKGDLEIRYAIRPLQRIEIDYQDPHSAVPEPNHMFNMLFHTLVGNLTQRGSRSPTREYSANQSKEFFNADWAALGVFDVVDAYSSEFDQAMLLALHKNAMADAYAVFLFDDYTQVKQSIQQSMTALKFKE